MEYSQPRGSDRWYCSSSPLGFSCSPHKHLHRFSGLPVLPAEIRPSELQISPTPDPRLSPCVLNLQGKKLGLVNRCGDSKARRVCGLLAFRGSECSQALFCALVRHSELDKCLNLFALIPGNSLFSYSSPCCSFKAEPHLHFFLNRGGKNFILFQ